MILPSDAVHFSPASLQLKSFTPLPWPLNKSLEQKPATPAEWFSHRFPDAAKYYGCPFLEVKWKDLDGLQYLKAVAMNEEFFAAILSTEGQFHHKTIYFEPEMQFYCLDKDQVYKVTTEEKLKIVLSLYLVKCAEEMPLTVDKFNLFVLFRQEQQLKAIVRKARSILAAGHSFFTIDSPYKRLEGPEVPGRIARIFTQTALMPKSQERLTLSQTYAAFRDFCERSGLMVVERRAFKGLISAVIRDEYGIGLRHDIVDEGGKYRRGWSGLTLKMPELIQNGPAEVAETTVVVN